MKVTVTFGDTSVVVPCKGGWTVRDLTEQATRRFRRILDQSGGSEVTTHHLEYSEGGILDMDDLLSDLVEDRDKLVAVFQEAHYGRTDSPRETMSNGFSSDAPSPEPLHYYSHLQYQDPNTGEIEVNEASLKANTPLLVRSSSDSALAPPFEIAATRPTDDHRNASPDPEVNPELRAASERLPDQHTAEKMSQVHLRTMTRSVEIPADRGPLGIHVVPYCSSLSGRTLGLHIKGIEANSRSRREKLFREDECIVQINDQPLQDKTFAQSQEVFRQAMGSASVRLEVLPVANKSLYEKSVIGQLFTNDIKDPAARTKSPVATRAKMDLQPRAGAGPEAVRPGSRPKTPDPGLQEAPPAGLRSGPGSFDRASPMEPAGDARSSPVLSASSQNHPDSTHPVMAALANLANKKGGKRIKIDLKKGAEGLGFTVVTREASGSGPAPILVKNILSRGAAIKDGRLQPGDRILEVNGVDMTGRSQEELVAMLRSTKQGESVAVVVARQEDIFLPRELKGEDGGSLVLEDGREQLMYEIPLNETGSAGLGVSLKGNKSRETGEDLGIFIKSIIHGGAAYKDGRLNVNDQLIAVNGESLLGRSNHTAMETLRRSMSSEGNARGTIQLVVLRVPRQGRQTATPPISDAGAPLLHQADGRPSSSNQEAYQRPPASSRPPGLDPASNGATPNTGGSRSAPPPAAANGGYGHYSNDEEDLEQSFPPPPSPGTVEEINRELPSLTPPHRSGYQAPPRPAADFHADGRLVSEWDNVPRNRASKSMDLVADESNVTSLMGAGTAPPAGGALGPTLGLWKSSSLESLQSAMLEVKQSQARVPFHRPRPHVVRGRGCNQSFRIAIDKSYDGPSEDDDDLSEQSSGRDTPASGSSRQDLDADEEKKKTKEKKKGKRSKAKKKAEPAEDAEKKSKKKGFGLLRFGRKKDDKSKETARTSKNKLEALSEEELDRTPGRLDGFDPHYSTIRPGRDTPDMEDDDGDPNYARIDNFRTPPSPRGYLAHTPSPAAPTGGANPPSADELDGLYAKINKPRPPAQTQQDSDERLQRPPWDYQQPRAAPGYDELDAARRRFLELDPQRVAPRGAESRPERRYEEVERTQPRRDPYDYPTHPRPVRREPSPHSAGRYADPPVPGAPAQPNPRYYPQPPQAAPQHRAAPRQDFPPSLGAGQRGRPYYEAAGGRVDAYRHASPGRYASPDRYGDERPARRKNPAIGAV